MKVKKMDILISGFALFAIFFGAGNLIFPPYLGVMSGQFWKEAMSGFLLADPVLPVLGVIATAHVGGRAQDLGRRVSPGFAKLLGTIAILSIGPFFAVPRTAATVHEIAVGQVFPNLPSSVTSIVFFLLTLILIFNESGVIDKVGAYLTPILLVILGAIFVKSLTTPPEPMVEVVRQDFFKLGFKEGYQTMDALGAALVTGIVVTDLKRRGYTEREDLFKAMLGVGLVCFILLSIVYGGLTYVGVTTGSVYGIDATRVELLIGSVDRLFGTWGKVALAIAVSLACLTTSVGLTATCGNYFDDISNGKLKYKYVVVAATAVSLILSLLGTEGLISLAGPILSIIYPVIIVLILLSLFDHHIPYRWTYIGAVAGALAISLIENLNGIFGWFGALEGFIAELPLSNIGFNWLIPAIICSAVCTIAEKAINKPKAKI